MPSPTQCTALNTFDPQLAGKYCLRGLCLWCDMLPQQSLLEKKRNLGGFPCEKCPTGGLGTSPQLPSGVLFPLFWGKGFPLKSTNPKKGCPVFSHGHRASGSPTPTHPRRCPGAAPPPPPRRPWPPSCRRRSSNRLGSKRRVSRGFGGPTNADPR